MEAFIFSLYQRLVLARPGLVLSLLGLLLGSLAFQAQHFELDASADSLLLQDDHDLRVFRQVSNRYADAEFLVVTFKPKQALFEQTSIRDLEELADTLAALPHVDSVLSLLDVPLVKNVDGPLSDIINNVRTLQSETLDKQRAYDELTNSPIFREMLISADGATTALRVNLKDHPQFNVVQEQRNQLMALHHNEELNATQRVELQNVQQQYDLLKSELDEQRHQTIQAVRKVLDDFSPRGNLHLGGIPMIADDMVTYIGNDLQIFGLGVFIFLVLMLWMIFRDIRCVLLPLISCLFAGVVMLGMLGLIGWQVTVISSNFISLMLIITMSMNMHLVVRYRQLRRDQSDLDHPALVALTMRKMVWPCLYTALTTIIAFLSLVFSNIKPVMDFGWMMTIGLIVTFITSFLLFPCALLKLGKLPVATDKSIGVALVNRLATFTLHRGKMIFISSGALIIISLIGIYQLRVENSFIDYFNKKTEIYQGMKLIDEQLGGTTPLEIILKFSRAEEATEEDNTAVHKNTDDELDDLLDEYETESTADAANWFVPEKIEIIKQAHDYLESLPEVGKVLSLASLIRVAEELNDDKPFSGIELAVLYKRLPDAVREEMIDPFVSIEADETRINLRILDSNPKLRRAELLRKIQHDLNTLLPLPEQQITVTGVMLLYSNMLQSLFDSQIKTLGAVMLGVALTLLVLFRSVPLAVIGILPNLFAAALILGLMGLLDIPLDIMTITIAAITIGIAVDNSIHYIYRFREEFHRSHDYRKTLRYCHANIGRAVIYTAITIIAGFSILVLSNFIPTVYFGLFTALAMAIALLAALTLLPRLIMLWKPFGQNPSLIE